MVLQLIFDMLSLLIDDKLLRLTGFLWRLNCRKNENSSRKTSPKGICEMEIISVDNNNHYRVRLLPKLLSAFAY